MNLKKIVVFCLLSLLYAIPNTVLAQQEPEKTYIDGKEFYLHKVSRGETLFAIGKKYGVELKDIVVWNPTASQGIKKGQWLKIPVITGLNNDYLEIEKPDEFTFHVVDKHQSLFTIAQLYHVDEDLITKYNPEVRLGLKTGQVLRIPLNYNESENSEAQFIYHKVSAHETLFYLAQKYSVNVEDIYAANPDLKSEGLKAGMTIKIPDLKYLSNNYLIVPENQELPYSDSLFFIEENRAPCEDFDYDQVMDTLRIALMLPLYLDYNQKDSLVNRSFSYYRNSKPFFDLYKGVLLALGNLKKEMNIKLYVYDTENSVSKVVKILGRPELRSVDLILGPVYSKNIQIVSKFANLHNINTVSLLSKNMSLLKGNPHLFQLNPSNETRIGQAALYLSNFYDSSIVVLHTGSLKEQDFLNYYKQKFIEAFQMNNALDKIVFKEVNYKIHGVDAIEDALSLGLSNKVIIPSTNEADVMEMLTKLDYLVNFYDITVYGMPEWEVFDNVELDLFARLKTHYPTATYIDYENQHVKNFVSKFRDNFSAEPSIYSFLGYDASNYFLKLLKNHGRNFQNCLQEPDVKKYSTGLITDYDFKSHKSGDGFENYGIFIIEYQKDYTLKVKAGGLQKGYYLNR